MELPVDYKSISQPQRRLVREEYVRRQNGLCQHCRAPLDKKPPKSIVGKPIRWSLFPGGRDFLRYPIHLHHSHKDGMTIGAVHAYCNAVLWQYHGE